MRYTYDAKGQLVRVKDSTTNYEANYRYDGLGRMIEMRTTGAGRDPYMVEYEYDSNGNLSSKTEYNNGTRLTTYSYDEANRPQEITTGNVHTLYEEYDNLNRVSHQRHRYKDETALNIYTTYRANSNQVQRLRNKAYYGSYNVALDYTYDNNGNIETVSDGTNTTKYVYNKANQLIREYNQAARKIWTWKYDDAGNLTHHREYNYSDTNMTTPLYTMRYTYGDASWGDLLTAYNGVAITYDHIGNPLNDGTWTYTWQRGRQLSYMTDGTTAWSMTYDADGLRTKRVTSTGSHYYYYYYENGLLTGMEFNGSILRFTYDAQGRPVSVSMDSTTYYYALNLQGDVVAIVDTKGNPVTTYTYNAWGKLISGSGSKYNSIGVINPLRYRGYVYDRETGLYYLQSRYYNPEICRFISPDDVSLIGANDAVISHNLYAYCSNNPVSRADDGGHFWHIVVGAVIGGVFELGSQLIANGGDFSEVNWTKVGIATAVGGVTAACGAASGAVISGLGNVAMEVAGGTTDATKLAVSFIVGAGASVAGYGAGKAAQKIGGKLAIKNLSKKSPGHIKRTVNKLIDVAGRDRNKVKDLSWALSQKAYQHLPDVMIGKTIPQLFNSAVVGISGYGTMGAIYGFT